MENDLRPECFAERFAGNQIQMRPARIMNVISPGNREINRNFLFPPVHHRLFRFPYILSDKTMEERTRTLDDLGVARTPV